jgi:hypothetical protein
VKEVVSSQVERGVLSVVSSQVRTENLEDQAVCIVASVVPR